MFARREVHQYISGTLFVAREAKQKFLPTLNQYVETISAGAPDYFRTIKDHLKRELAAFYKGFPPATPVEKIAEALSDVIIAMEDPEAAVREEAFAKLVTANAAIKAAAETRRAAEERAAAERATADAKAAAERKIADALETRINQSAAEYKATIKKAGGPAAHNNPGTAMAAADAKAAADEAARATTEALHAKAAGGGAAPSPSADTCNTGWYATSLDVKNSPWQSGGHCPDRATHPREHAAFIEVEAEAQERISLASRHFG